MHFDFLTPALFDYLIYANLTVGILLIILRFTLDMRRRKPVVDRAEVHDESSSTHLDDTNPSLAQDTETNQNKTRSQQ